MGLVTTVVSIDSFHRGIGAALEPLPEPRGGAPNNYRPGGLSDLGAYVPMIPARKAKGPEVDLYDGMPPANVIGRPGRHSRDRAPPGRPGPRSPRRQAARRP